MQRADASGFHPRRSSWRWWWEDASLPKQDIDADFDWDHRDTGISKKTAETYLVEWSHYNSTGLRLSSWPPVPWTRGRLQKQMRAIDKDSFTLHNVFEESAIGNWVGGKENLKPVINQHGDKGLYEQRHTFHRTPRRITQLPAKLPEHWPAEAGDSRATLCGKAVVSGPRWLAPLKEVKTLKQMRESRGDFLRFDFAEIWLTLDGNRKVGMFVNYDGITGELMHMFVMRQARVNDNNNNKALPSSLDVMEERLVSEQLWPVLPPCRQAFQKSSSVASFV